MNPLSEWESFYVIVGSSAGALTGLLFVVIALIAELPITEGVAAANDAFSTPTIVHFGAVLLLSGIMSAPWDRIVAPAVLWGVIGAGGLVYSLIVARRMRSQTAYRPVFEDWLFHAILPAGTYAALSVAAFETLAHVRGALFGVGAAALLLLFVGIHNAWDSVTYIVFVRKREEQPKPRG